jgi:hypothetical protein
MDKLQALSNKLKMCYQKHAPFAEDYVRLNRADRDHLCADVREEFKKFLYSDELRTSNLIKNEVNAIKSNPKITL